MRKLLCVLLVSILGFCAANAQILLYKGVIKTRVSGDGADSRQTQKVWLIYDSTNCVVGRINFFPSGNFYSVDADQSVTSNLVRLPYQKTATVLSSAGTTGDAGSQTIASLFARGNNTRIQVARNTYASVPKVLDWNARRVGPAGDPPATEIQEDAGVVTLDEALTNTSNNKGDTLEGAKARIARNLEALGYREIVFK